MSTEAIPIRRSGKTGILIFIAGEIAIFGSIFAIYFLFRLKYSAWHEPLSHISVLPGAINTVILLTSSFLMLKAQRSSYIGNVKGMVMGGGGALLLGLLFLIVKYYEYYTHISHGFTINMGGNDPSSLFWSFYYFMTGLHALHIVAGIIAGIIILIHVRRTHKYHRVDYLGIYWHMVDTIWLCIFTILYLIK